MGFGKEDKIAYAHERMILSMPPERAKRYKEQLESELESLTEKKLDILKMRDRYLEHIDNVLANLDIRQKEISQDLNIIDGSYILKGLEDQEDGRLAFWSGCLY